MARKGRKNRRKLSRPIFDWPLIEDPLQLDSLRNAGLEGIQKVSTPLHEAVRPEPRSNPWHSPGQAPEVDLKTELRRKSLEELRLSVEEDQCDTKGESVA